MQRWSVLSLALLLVVGMCEAASSAEPFLIVLNKSDNTASLVDPATLEVRINLPTGRAPHEAAASPDGRFVYVANYGRETDGNTLTVIDVAARKVAGTIDLGDFKRPHGIRVSRDGRTLWVTCEANQAVLGIEAATGKIVENYGTGQRVSHMLVPSHDEQKLYVASIGSGTVTVIDRKTRQVESLPTGAGAEGIDISPDGKFVWIANRSANTISVLDTATETIVTNLKAGGEMPIRVKFTLDGKEVLVSNARSNTVSVFDAVRREEIAKIQTGFSPVGILVAPDGRRAFVANTESNQVFVLDIKQRRVIGTFHAGTEPDGMAWVP